MKDLTASIYTFEELIKGNYLYIDKTEFIWKLIRPYKGIYFMSRPRRFGKSLTVSTLKAIFQGRKDLFEGLAIHNKPYDWKMYPVIHLDMGNCTAKTADDLENFLYDILSAIAALFGTKLRGQSNAMRFECLITDISAAANAPVVILLDEYDKPILNTIATAESKGCRDVLKGFYSTIKKCESLERFVFVTGVTKFSHVSLFSELNNLTDINMDYDYATMFGYTQAEFEEYFATHIATAVKHLKIPREQFLSEIKRWYDGYRFHADVETVYNPVSLAMFFNMRYEFNNYWFSTGTPSFLIDLVQKTNFNFPEVISTPVSAMAFDAFEIDDIDPLPLLLQTGYLTIKSAERRFNTTWYQLDFPNLEVSASFNTWLLNAYAGKNQK